MNDAFDDDDILFLDEDPIPAKPKPTPKPAPNKEFEDFDLGLDTPTPKPNPAPAPTPIPNAAPKPPVPKPAATKRPVIDVGQEDELDQGSTYNGDEDVTPTKEAPKRRERPVRERPVKERPEREPLFIKYFVARGGVVLVGIVLLVVGAIILNKRAVKMQEEEESKRIDEIMQTETSMYYFTYSREEKEELRLAGYTGTEIEEFEMNGLDAQEKIREAEEARKAKYDEELKPYFAGASDKFMELWNDSWVGQDSFDVSSDLNTYQTYTMKLNLDYEKVASTGYQCWLKVYLEEDSYFFIFIGPQRWTELADRGNMVLELTYTNQGENGKSVITGWREIIN